MKSSTNVTGPKVVAAIVTAAGTALAIAIWIRRAASQRSGAVLKRCDRAVGELERHLVPSAGTC